MLRRLGAAALTAWLCLPVHVRAQCEREITIEGDAALVAELRATLRARSRTGCLPSSEAVVEVTPTESGLTHLSLRGPEGASAVREVEQMTTAAVLVESWCEVSVLDVLEPPRVEPEAPPEVAPSARDDASVPAEPEPEAPPEDVLLITADGVAAFGNDESSTWFGVDVGACAHVGPVCLGGDLRFVEDSNLSGESSEERGQRTLLVGAVELSLPLHPAPQFTIAPSVAVGLGWLDIVAIESMRTATVDGIRALVTGTVAGAVAVLDWLALELRLGVVWSPLARQADWLLDGVEIDADPVVSGLAMLGVRMEVR